MARKSKKELEEAKIDEAKIGETKTEEIKIEEVKVEEVKVDEVKVDEVKVDEAKVEEPKTAETEIDDSVSEKTEKESKPRRKFTPHVISFSGMYNRIKENLWLMLGTLLVSFFVVVLLAIVIFFVAAKGPEKVMVPDVIGKKLENGLLEMQVKELYPKISLRYSDTPGDEGTILDQSPKSGAIVKGYSRVSLVVSRGVIADQVGNYVGLKVDEMRMNLQTLFAGSTRPLILIGDIVYQPDTSEAGSILEQDPPEGTRISDPIKVNLVVSRGPQYENTKPPYLIGRSINDVLQTITRSKLIFDFTAYAPEENEIPGTVVNQESFDSEFVPNYSHMAVGIAIPTSSDDGNIYGIFEKELDEYPYPVPMRLDAVPEEGDSYTIISFNHTGGKVTIPYIVPAETTLVLYAGDKVAGRETVH
ncbi:MAG: PASTA domain-containing protein [Treponema sp.]|nr:PASTA domain-containing protein [Treponema sp.]